MRERLTEEEKETLEFVDRCLQANNHVSIERWFKEHRPWDVSMVLGLCVLQHTVTDFKGTTLWDVWAMTWTLVHRTQDINILSTDFVPPDFLDAAIMLRIHDEDVRRKQATTRRKKAPRWHILGKL